MSCDAEWDHIFIVVRLTEGNDVMLKAGKCD